MPRKSEPAARGQTRRNGLTIPTASELWKPQARSWFNSLALSGQSEWYEASDWATAVAAAQAYDMWLRTQSPGILSQFVRLSERLGATITDRRRSGIELDEPEHTDADEEAADQAVNNWQLRLVKLGGTMASKSFTSAATGAIVARVDAGCGTTNTSPVVTDAAITMNDVGKPVTGTGIPAGSTIIAVVPGVSFTMSANATATGTIAATIVAVADAGAGKTFRQFTLRAQSVAVDSVVALETSPDNTTWTEQARVTGGPFGAWCYAASNHARRYARPNVINLGTGAPPVAAVISYY